MYGGLDLSETSDLTALILMGRPISSDVWNVHPTFWIPEEGLEERAVAARVPFDLWRDQGYLNTTPGRTVSYEYVANHLKALFDRYRIDKLAFDRWNFKHLKPWLLKAGLGENFITNHFVEFGQGYASISPAMRDTEELMLNKKIAHGDHPVLAMCMNNAVVVKDDAGNRKLSKKRSTGRIDGAVALLMAVGVAPLTKAIDLECLIA